MDLSKAAGMNMKGMHIVNEIDHYKQVAPI